MSESDHANTADPVIPDVAADDQGTWTILVMQGASVIAAIVALVMLINAPAPNPDQAVLWLAPPGIAAAGLLLVLDLVCLFWTWAYARPGIVLLWAGAHAGVGIALLVVLVLASPADAVVVILTMAGVVFTALATGIGIRGHARLLALEVADQDETLAESIQAMPGMQAHAAFVRETEARRRGMANILGIGIDRDTDFNENTLVATEKLTKYYGPTCALLNLTMGVQRGEIVGLLGPNGAGKTTAMKILTTYLRPTWGRGRVAGFDVVADPLQVRRRVGYLPETNPLYREMRVSAYLEFVAWARHLPEAVRKRNLAWVREVCGLESVWHQPIRELSKGYKQRVGLAQAIIHEPDILILDEPSSGLDPNQIIEMRNLIREVGRGKTVILSTHILQEVEAVCSRVLVIDQGELVANGPIEELSQALAPLGRLKITLSGKVDGVGKALKRFKGVAEAEETYRDAEEATVVTVRPEGEPAVVAGLSSKLLEACGKKGWTVQELHRQRASLEDVFVNLTVKSLE